ncbi:MAG TPA: extracellular solute-binding protein [candidate division Zixibacteria bacterium]|nr:extracellular solute-binding protein [candidate division Zixibacteria bacterium]
MNAVLAALLTLCLAAAAHLAGAAPGWGQTEDRVKLIEGARKEGKVVWYTSTNITESKPLLQDFEQQYPFIKGEIFRASGEKTLNRIVTEARAGRHDFDLVTISEVDALTEARMLQPYRSPESKNFIPEFKHPSGYWTAVYINYATIGYNPKLVPEKDAPKQWEDLLDPRWKGKISIDQEQYSWYGTLHKAWGRERAQKYMRALAKQDIQWRKGHTLIAQLMAAGEFPMGVIYAHRIEEMKKRGAPVEWVSTVNPIVVTVNAAAISARPQHPNAAKLFYDFLLSKAAQQRLRSLRRIPARSDVEPFSPRMEQSKLKLQVEPPQSGAQFNQTIKEFREIFGL